MAVATAPVEVSGLCRRPQVLALVPANGRVDRTPAVTYMHVPTRFVHPADEPRTLCAAVADPRTPAGGLPMWQAQSTAAHAPAELPRARLGLRFNGRVVSLSAGKTTIGSAARCTLRIEEPGVEPLHCLIVYAEDGATVRRWAGAARLNGEVFSETPLAAEDRLTIGPVELEIVDLSAEGACGSENHSLADKPEVAVTRPEAATPSPPSNGSPVDTDDANDAAEVVFQQFRSFQPRAVLSRDRRRKLFTALRRNRDALQQLARRVTQLEQCRDQWQQQLADWNDELGRWEPRLDEQARRIDELQQELAALRLVRTGAEPREPLAVEVAPTPPAIEPLTDSAADGARVEEPQTESFIERYAHLFADESATADEAEHSVPQEQSAVSDPGDVSGAPADDEPPQACSAPDAAEPDEESVEQYLAKLLERVRGETHRPAVALEEEIEPVEPEPPVARPSFNFAMLKTSSPAPQTDLEALRALANETARRAISSHALRKHRRTATTKVIVAMLAGMTSLWLMLQSPSWWDWQCITACASMAVATYWAVQAYRTLVALWEISEEDQEGSAREEEAGVGW